MAERLKLRIDAPHSRKLVRGEPVTIKVPLGTRQVELRLSHALRENLRCVFQREASVRDCALRFMPPARPFPYSVFSSGIEVAMFRSRTEAAAFAMSDSGCVLFIDTTGEIERLIAEGQIIPRVPPAGYKPEIYIA